MNKFDWYSSEFLQPCTENAMVVETAQVGVNSKGSRSAEVVGRQVVVGVADIVSFWHHNI